MTKNNGPFRQQNKFDINFVKFPNDEIQNSQEFVKIVKKLFWSCSPNITRYLLGIKFDKIQQYFERFSYKRGRLEKTYPKLCPFYDEFFFPNDNISTQLREG